MSVAVKLETLGVPRERIVLFPAHDPDPACFVSEHARANWRPLSVVCRAFVPERFVPAGARDVSAAPGVISPEYGPPVQPQHERRKYLYEGRLWKFAGLGQFGRTKLERAQRLEQFCPRAYDLSNGFLISEWVPRPSPRNVRGAARHHGAVSRIPAVGICPRCSGSDEGAGGNDRCQYGGRTPRAAGRSASRRRRPHASA
jgi:hypothetical protein